MRPARSAPLSREELVQLCHTGRADGAYRPAAQPTGYIELDQALPGGGLPVGAMTEIMATTEGIGELRLIVSALAKLTAADRYIAFVQPPYFPYPPALAQHGVKLERLLAIRNCPTHALWAAEQLLRCPALGAVLIWANTLNDKEARRLQLAAESGNNLAIVYRPITAAQFTSPAALRLLLHPGNPLRVEIKKCRGGRADFSVRCALDAQIKCA